MPASPDKRPKNLNHYEECTCHATEITQRAHRDAIKPGMHWEDWNGYAPKRRRRVLQTAPIETTM